MRCQIEWRFFFLNDTKSTNIVKEANIKRENERARNFHNGLWMFHLKLEKESRSTFTNNENIH